MHEKPLAEATLSQLKLWKWLMACLIEGFTNLPLPLHQHLLCPDGAQRLEL